MKKLLLLTIASISILSCKTEPIKDYAVISGKVDNFRKRSIKLIGHGYETKIKFDRKTKTFNDTIKGLKAGHYTLLVGKRKMQVYLDSVKDLNINVDAKKRTKSPVFKSEDLGLANINNYIESRRKKYAVVLGNANKLFGADEDVFLNKMDKYKDVLNKLAEGSQLPEDYLAKEKRNINYEYVRNLNNYQGYHRILTGDDEFEVSSEFPNTIEDVDFNSAEDYHNSFTYRFLIKEHLNNKAFAKTPENGDQPLTFLETVHSEISNQEIKNDLVYNIAKEHITYTANLPEFYKKFKRFSTNEKHKKEITDIYDKLKLTAKGMPSPKFENFQNYDGGTTSLDDLLGHGKYLYIDVWATWCSFCKKEIPLLKNFEQKYADKNIEFVSINVDTRDKFNKWKASVKEKEMGGVQLFSGKGHLNLPFAQKYLIKGLPRFILLDPNGKIISPNAPRPSDGYKLDEIFEEIGIEE